MVRRESFVKLKFFTFTEFFEEKNSKKIGLFAILKYRLLTNLKITLRHYHVNYVLKDCSKFTKNRCKVSNIKKNDVKR